MQYVNAYFSLLREAMEDIKGFFITFEDSTSVGFVLASAVLIPVFGCFLFFAVLVNAAEYVAPTPSAVLEATQIDSHTILLTLANNTVALNAAEVEFFFDPAHLRVENIIITDSLCEERFIITKEIDNETGRVFYQCGTITPFVGTSTTLALLDINTLKTGTTSISFGQQTNVLAHDGYGSNVTKERNGGDFISG